METEAKNPTDTILHNIAAAVLEWQSLNTPETIRERVFELLDRHQKETAMRLLGFRWCHWNKHWLVDTTNGRDRNSFVNQTLAPSIQTACADWIQNMVPPALTPVQAKKAERAVKDYADDLFNSQLRERVQERLDHLLAERVEALVDDSALVGYIKAQDLINLT